MIVHLFLRSFRRYFVNLTGCVVVLNNDLNGDYWDEIIMMKMLHCSDEAGRGGRFNTVVMSARFE